MNQERLAISSERGEMEELSELYKTVHELGGVIRETKQAEGFLTCVGDEAHFRAALKLEDDEPITQEALDELPLLLLFAYPGVGTTRTEALTNAFEGWKTSKENAQLKRDLYGTFEIAGGKMSAYLPTNDTQRPKWTIEYSKNDEVVFTDELEMFHEPIFGADVEDVAMLNERIEELILQYGLES